MVILKRRWRLSVLALLALIALGGQARSARQTDELLSFDGLALRLGLVCSKAATTYFDTATIARRQGFDDVILEMLHGRPLTLDAKFAQGNGRARARRDRGPVAETEGIWWRSRENRNVCSGDYRPAMASV